MPWLPLRTDFLDGAPRRDTRRRSAIRGDLEWQLIELGVGDPGALVGRDVQPELLHPTERGRHRHHEEAAVASRERSAACPHSPRDGGDVVLELGPCRVGIVSLAVDVGVAEHRSTQRPCTLRVVRCLAWCSFNLVTCRHRSARHPSALVDLAVLHHELDPLGDRDVAERIAGDADDVGDHLGRDPTELRGVDQLGADRRGGADRLERRHPPLDEDHELLGVAAVPDGRGVAAAGDLDAGGDRLA